MGNYILIAVACAACVGAGFMLCLVTHTKPLQERVERTDAKLADLEAASLEAAGRDPLGAHAYTYCAESARAIRAALTAGTPE